MVKLITQFIVGEMIIWFVKEYWKEYRKLEKKK
jgi:hypothetical protein